MELVRHKTDKGYRYTAALFHFCEEVGRTKWGEQGGDVSQFEAGRGRKWGGRSGDVSHKRNRGK